MRQQRPIPNDPQRNIAQGLCLFLEKFGTKVDLGWEMHFSNESLERVELAAQIQVEKKESGVVLRYFPNRMVEGVLVDGGRTEPTETTATDEQA